MENGTSKPSNCKCIEGYYQVNNEDIDCVRCADYNAISCEIYTGKSLNCKNGFYLSGGGTCYCSFYLSYWPYAAWHDLSKRPEYWKFEIEESLSQAFSIYSVRLLNFRYRGPCFRIVNSNLSQVAEVFMNRDAEVVKLIL